MAWADDPRFVISRHTLTPAILSAGIVGGALGTSITQGTGSSGPTKVFSYQLAGLLKSFSGVKSVIGNRGVGSSNILTMLMYLSDVVDMGTNGNSAPLGIKSGTKNFLNPMKTNCIIFEGPRNDIGVIDPIVYGGLLDLLFRQCLKKGVTPLFRTSTPQIDWTGNPYDPIIAIKDNNPAYQQAGSQYGDYYDQIVSICERRGVSLIDTWKYRVALYNQGFDLRKMMSDATHPNDNGHLDDARLAALCLLRGQDEEAANWDDEQPVMFPDIIANYYPWYGVTAKTAINGIQTAGTARNDELSEGNYGFALNVGDGQKYHAPVPLVGVIAALCDSPAHIGAVDVIHNGVTIGNALSVPGNATRESPKLALINQDDPTYLSSGDVLVNYNSGASPLLFGVMLLCAQQTSDDTIPQAQYNDSNWVSSVFVNGNWPLSNCPCWQTETVGQKLSFSFNGRFLGYYTSTGNNRGVFSYQVDGSDPVDVDCYSNAPFAAVFRLIDFGTEGIHNVTFMSEVQNPASRAGFVELGSFRTFSMIPSRCRQSVPIAGKSADMRQAFPGLG